MRKLVVFLVAASIFGLVYWAFSTFEFIDVFSFSFIVAVLAAIGWFAVAVLRGEAAKNG